MLICPEFRICEAERKRLNDLYDLECKGANEQEADKIQRCPLVRFTDGLLVNECCVHRQVQALRPTRQRTDQKESLRQSEEQQHVKHALEMHAVGYSLTRSAWKMESKEYRYLLSQNFMSMMTEVSAKKMM